MVPFVYLASVCWSLQCLISALTQAGGGGLLFRFTSSVAPRGGGALFSLSTLLRLPAALYGACPAIACGSSFRVLDRSADLVVPAFCAFPGPSSSGSQELDRRTLSGCGAPSPLRSPSLSFCTRRLGAPCVCSGELVSSCDPPGGCQPSRISGSLWLETGSLFAVW